MPEISFLRKISARKIFSQWNWGFLALWTLLITLAWMAAFWAQGRLYGWLVHLLPQIRIGVVSSTAVILTATGALFGLVIGFSQSFLLRRTFAIPSGWTRAHVLACAIIWTLPQSMDPALRRIAIGAVIGLLQWLVLRRKFPGHSWWILAGGVSWNAADFLAFRTFQWLSKSGLLRLFSWDKELAAAGGHGVLYGVFSGFALCYLLHYTLFVSKRARLRKISPPRKEVFALSWVVMNGIFWGIAYGRIGQLAQHAFLGGTGLPAHVILEKAFLQSLAALGIWLVLWRQHFRHSVWWIVWNGIGAAAGIFIWTTLKLENASGILLYGAVVGFFQWFVLSQRFRFFLLWLPLRTVAWGGALILAARIGERVTADVGWGAGGIAYGLVTGAFLYRQLK